jgi:hypothetical protein
MQASAASAQLRDAAAAHYQVGHNVMYECCVWRWGSAAAAQPREAAAAAAAAAAQCSVL